MKNFIIYNKNTGQILSSGICQNSTFLKQAKKDEFVMEGTANDVTQKIVDGKVVDKTPEELEVQKPPVIPKEKQQTFITNEQLEIILSRITALEEKLEKGK